MITNTVVVTLRDEDENNFQSFDDFVEVVLMELQFEIDDLEQLIIDKNLHLVKLANFFKKLLFVSKDLELSERIYSILKVNKRLHNVAYSLKDTIIESKDEYNYLQLPEDFSSKLLISPPHTPIYGAFNPLLAEESPVKKSKFNDELLKHSIKIGDNTVALLNASKSGVNITLTNCCDKNEDGEGEEEEDEEGAATLKDDTLNITQANATMPPKSIFDEIDQV
ncbi:hypothetical protein ACO0SA_000245 [Hanseniaspora valbyensis]